jgi:para-aminobenzoate synthetase
MPRHGIVSQVTPLNLDIFQGFREFEATNYHSLHVDLGYGPESRLEDLARKGTLCPDIQPLAWDTKDLKNGLVLLGGRHTSKPFWGVQYHPESICTSEEGGRIVSAWWRAASKWLAGSQRPVLRAAFPRLRRQVQELKSRCASTELADMHFKQLQQLKVVSVDSEVRWRKLNRQVTDLNQLCKDLGLSSPKHDEAIVLRSGMQKDGRLFGQGLGRFSIIGVLGKDTLHVQYDVQSKSVKLHQRSNQTGISINKPVKDVFAYIKQLMSLFQVNGGPPSIPFWGGLMGYISFEAGLETIDVQPTRSMTTEALIGVERPDVNFAFVTRSIVVDHELDCIYVQSILEHDTVWLDTMFADLTSTKSDQHPTTNGIINGFTNGTTNFHTNGHSCRPKATASTPEKSHYIKKISKCSTSIRAGDSYELCLTAQTRVKYPSSYTPFQSGWSLFEQLSKTNPAPFSSFIRLHSPSDSVTIVSSSPERFLSWSRAGHCQFRPIKGTVKKAPGVTYEDAQKILESSKERAENLMITDLIRHDLNGVARLGTVQVPKLMQIEEYATVYQLVSVIEGDVSIASSSSSLHTNGVMNGATNGVTNGITNEVTNEVTNRVTNGATNGKHKTPPTAGLDLLAASLPPGSMTGAPKRRSCELLSQYEQQAPRGIYSGVLGYLDVGGGGDFAVVIRTAVRWDKDDEVWSVGAGGAITAQSDVEDEFVEMVTKLDSTLGAFGLKGNGSPL